MTIRHNRMLRALQFKHRPWTVGVLLALLLIGVVIFAVKSVSTTRPDSASQVDQVRELVQACTVQMIKNTCRVSAGPTVDPALPRLFIAGVGEVDAAAYADLQRHGDAMCQSAGAHCQTDWHGAACRIAQALYLPIR